MKKRQQGLTTVEAAFGAALMLILIFGTIEISRAVFVWNFLDEAARRGARVAAVCPFNHPAIRRVAVLAPPNGPDDSPYIRGLSASNIDIEYLDAAGDPSTVFEETKFVRVSIFDKNNPPGNRFEIPLLLFNEVDLTAPPFSTTLPSESMGYKPDTGTCRCFGIPGTVGTEGCDWTL